LKNRNYRTLPQLRLGAERKLTKIESAVRLAQANSGLNTGFVCHSALPYRA